MPWGPCCKSDISCSVCTSIRKRKTRESARFLSKREKNDSGAQLNFWAENCARENAQDEYLLAAGVAFFEKYTIGCTGHSFGNIYGFLVRKAAVQKFRGDKSLPSECGSR